MKTRRMILRFPKEIISKPVISGLSKNYDVEFSILKAKITPEEQGVMLLDITGEIEVVSDAIQYLKNNSVILEEPDKDIKMNDERCTSCGACLVVCPTQALYRDMETFKVHFDSEKCIACELCIAGCPYNAMEVHF